MPPWSEIVGLLFLSKNLLYFISTSYFKFVNKMLRKTTRKKMTWRNYVAQKKWVFSNMDDTFQGSIHKLRGQDLPILTPLPP